MQLQSVQFLAGAQTRAPLKTPASGAKSKLSSSGTKLALLRNSTSIDSKPPSSSSSAAIQALSRSFAGWDVHLPVNAKGELKGKSISVRWPQVTGEGSRSALAQQLAKYVAVQGDGSVKFTSPSKGATTSSRAGGPRAELRQKAEWQVKGGQAQLHLVQTLQRTPAGQSPVVFIGQAHDAKDRLVIVRYEGPKNANGKTDTGRLEVVVNEKPSKTFVIDPAYRLGDKMAISMVVRDGKLTVLYGKQGAKPTATEIEGVTLRPQSDKAYFKVGAYTKASSKVDGDAVLVLHKSAAPTSLKAE
jgi:hypothetical protein